MRKEILKGIFSSWGGGCLSMLNTLNGYFTSRPEIPNTTDSHQTASVLHAWVSYTPECLTLLILAGALRHTPPCHPHPHPHPEAADNPESRGPATRPWATLRSIYTPFDSCIIHKSRSFLYWKDFHINLGWLLDKPRCNPHHGVCCLRSEPLYL